MKHQELTRAGLEAASATGLEGVVVAETRLSHVDGEAGRLVIAGCDVESLALSASFEEVAARLWNQGGLDEPCDVAALSAARVRAFATLPSLGDALSAPHVMDALRTGISHLDEGASACEIVGAVAVLVSAWARTRQGLVPIAPKANTAHAQDMLAMLGLDASPARARALDSYFVTISDHGLNASTFAARVVTSTGSDRVSATVAAVGALKGPLHGGAPLPVLDMLDALTSVADPQAWLAAELAAGRRIMGMGHRIYRVRDPRALVLERALETMHLSLRSTEGTPTEERVAIRKLDHARRVERAAERVLHSHRPHRALRANVEFYTAVLLDTIGIPREVFTGIFATGRVIGWMAHVSEQQRTGRLVRPASRYVGPMPKEVHVI